MARNLAEKMRRDKLNTHINELSTLVPMTAGSSKKMDKTSILRLSATYIRMNKSKFYYFLCLYVIIIIIIIVYSFVVVIINAVCFIFPALKPDKSWQLLPKELKTVNLSQYLMEVSVSSFSLGEGGAKGEKEGGDFVRNEFELSFDIFRED